jgi:tetratricopeptide (TPR) repeat protein
MMRLLFAALLASLPLPAFAARTPLQAYMAGDFSLVVRDYDSASRYFGAALAATPDDMLLRRRAFELALTSGNFDRALRLAEDIRKSDQAISSVNQLLVMDAVRRQDWTTASKLLEKMPEVGIDALLVPLLKTWTAVGKGNLTEARTALEAVERGGGMAGFYRHQSAWANLIGGDKAAATLGFAELTKNPANAGTNNVIAAASLLSAQGARDAALKLLRYAEPRQLPPAINRAIATLEAGKTLQAPLRTAPEGLANALTILASELARDDIKGASVNFAQLAAWLASDQLEYKLALADILAQADRNIEANQVLNALDEARGDNIEVVIAQARVLSNSEDLAGAEKLLQDARVASPNRAELHIALGDVLRSQEQFSKAAEAYSQALQLQPQPYTESGWGIFFARAVCYERLKIWDKAEADLKQALVLRPDDPTLLNYLGYTWLDQKRNISEATKMIERALELRPGDGAIIDSLGWAHFMAGNIDKAIELLEQAIAAVPGDPTVNEHLGDAYWAAGRALEARHRWSAARESDPDKDQLARLDEKLDVGAGGEQQHRAS